jgi:hypothetical protein
VPFRIFLPLFRGRDFGSIIVVVGPQSAVLAPGGFAAALQVVGVGEGGDDARVVARVGVGRGVDDAVGAAEEIDVGRAGQDWVSATGGCCGLGGEPVGSRVVGEAGGEVVSFEGADAAQRVVADGPAVDGGAVDFNEVAGWAPALVVRGASTLRFGR